MKVSICLTYYNRKELLHNTLKSIFRSKHINDVEILIVDDASDENNRIEDLILGYSEYNIKLFRFEPSEKWWKLQIPPHNKLISMAQGDYVIQQGSECFHRDDIIDDVINNIEGNMYRVYGCYALTETDTKKLINDFDNYEHFKPLINNSNLNIFSEGGWYQHSIYNNRQLNFCTAILRKDLLELGGFDERFSNGRAWGDNEFITRIRRKKMNIISIDDYIVYHQYHEPNLDNSYDPNQNLFNLILTEDIIKVKNSFI
jgi:glycosyltransferase involved in cell wall biosynthesis